MFDYAEKDYVDNDAYWEALYEQFTERVAERMAAAGATHQEPCEEGYWEEAETLGIVAVVPGPYGASYVPGANWDKYAREVMV